MELVIPDGAQVHITVGQPPLLALPQDPRAVASLPERSSGRIVKSLIAGVLLIGARIGNLTLRVSTQAA